MVVPFDLAAVMRQSDPSKEVFRSAFQAMKKAYSKHGIAALKAGTLLRSVIVKNMTYWLMKHQRHGGGTNVDEKPLSFCIGLINILGTEDEIKYVQGFFPHQYKKASSLVDTKQLEQEIDAFFALSGMTFNK